MNAAPSNRRSSRPRMTGAVMAVALFAALIAAVSLLFFFKDYLRIARQRTPERIAAGLRPELLRARAEVPRFDLIEDAARRLREDFPSLAQVFITKLRPDSVECCIYPWNRREQPPEELPSIKIEQDGVVLGYLYYRLDQRRAMLFEGIVNALIPLLILAAFAMAFHVWRQDRVLATTRVQLVEKNRELAHLERLSLAGQLAANLLHDLKKPVLHIRDELEAGEIPPDPGAMREQVDFFFQMLREANLENLASASDEREEFLDVEEILRASVNLVKYERNQVEVKWEVSPRLPLVRGYKYRLIQVFSNLLLNAFQALGGKGEVRIRARCEPPSMREMIVEIEDNGPGIAPEHLSKVFQPFYSASGRSDSSGLGLYICKSIVEELGGRIGIESEPGKRTRVRVTLPAE